MGVLNDAINNIAGFISQSRKDEEEERKRREKERRIFKATEFEKKSDSSAQLRTDNEKKPSILKNFNDHIVEPAGRAVKDLGDRAERTLQTAVSNPEKFSVGNALSTGELTELLPDQIEDPIKKVTQPVGEFIENRVANPIKGFSELNKAITEEGDWKERGLKAVGGLANTAGLSPVGLVAGTFGVPALDAGKNTVEAVRKGENVGKAAVEGLTGERVAGLGDAFTDDKNIASVANMAELPLIVAAPGIKNTIGGKAEDAAKSLHYGGMHKDDIAEVLKLKKMQTTHPEATADFHTRFGTMIDGLSEFYIGKKEEVRNMKLEEKLDLLYEKAQEDFKLNNPFSGAFKKPKTAMSLVDDAGEQLPESVVGRLARESEEAKSKVLPEDAGLNKTTESIDDLPVIPETPPSTGNPGDLPPIKPGDDIIYDQTGDGKIHKTKDPNKFEYDLKSMATPEDVKFVIEDVVRKGQESGVLQQQRRGTMTETQIRKMADNLGMSYEDVLKRKPGQIWNAEQADAANRLALNANEEVFNITDKIRQAKESGTDVPQELIAQQMEAVTRAVGIQAAVIGDRSEAARALRASQILKEAMANPDARQRLIVDGIKMFAGDEKKAQEVTKRLSEFDPQDTYGMIKFLRQIKPNTPMDMIKEYWYNSVLSGTATHTVNTIGNTAAMLLKVPERAIAGGIDAAVSGVTGKERSRYATEAATQLNGIGSGFSKGIRKAWKVMQTGVNEADATKLEIGRGQAIPGLAGDIINIPSRFLAASDEVFRGINYEMELWAQATRAAKNEGLKGEEYAQRVAEIVNNPDGKIMEAAREVAKYNVFQADSKTADAVINFRDNVAALELGKFGRFQPVGFVIPFVKTAINVLKYGLERSPAGIAATGYKVATGASKGEVVDQAARAFMGTAMMTPLAMYVADGRITGAPPKDKKEKDAFYADGKLPWSIKIGDQWVSYQRIEPFNTILAQLALYNETFKEGEEIGVEEIASFARNVGHNFADQTFMTGIGNLVDAIEDPGRYGSKFITDILGGFVPSIVAATARATDTDVRKPETVQDSLAARLPDELPLLPGSEDVPGLPSEFEEGGVAKRRTNDGIGRNFASNFLGFRSTEDTGLDQYEQVKEIRDIERANREESDRTKELAGTIYQEMLAVDPKERGTVLKQYADQGALTDEVKDALRSEIKAGIVSLNGVEKSLQGSSTKTRAQYMYEQLQDLSPEERLLWIKNAKEKKILTGDVLDEFQKIVKRKRAEELDALPVVAP